MPKTILTLVFEYDEKIPRNYLDEHLKSELQHAKKYPVDFANAENLVEIEIRRGNRVERKSRRKT